MQRERVIDRRAHRVSEFSSIANFLNVDGVPAGISTIMSGGLPIDLLVSPAASRTTICFFHGAVEPHFTLPVLSGLGISGGIEANRVFISDPSLILDEELMLAWYAGNKHQPALQSDITAVLKKVTASLESERVVFFGGSGGGFAALYFAHHFENSLAIVFNPQTSIERYSENAVRDFVRFAFDDDVSHQGMLSELPRTVTHDLCGLYATPTSAQIAYMQNLNDKDHTEHHLLPFLKAVDSKTKVHLLGEQWRDGHTPPPKEFLSHLLNLVASSADWSEGFAPFGFKNLEGMSVKDAESLHTLRKLNEVSSE